MNQPPPIAALSALKSVDATALRSIFSYLFEEIRTLQATVDLLTKPRGR